MTLEEYCKEEGSSKVRVYEGDGKKYILVAVRHPDFGHINGYVGVPKGTEFDGYSEWTNGDWRELWMHGGCTFGGTMPNYDLFDEDYYFIGFDTAHMNDLQPKKWDGEEWKYQDLTEEEFGIGAKGGYKDMKYVWNGLEDILEQMTKEKEEDEI